MRLARLFLLALLCGAMLSLTGCYDLVYRRHDMNTVRRQFHLPRSASFLSFRSSPETPGWFGREGLRITATVTFPGDSFDEYVARLDDPEVWKPVRYLSYSPSAAEEYSDKALFLFRTLSRNAAAGTAANWMDSIARTAGTTPTSSWECGESQSSIPRAATTGDTSGERSPN